MENTRASGFLAQKPVLANVVGMAAVILLVAFHAWVRDFTAFQFVLELVALSVAFLVIQFRPTWWASLRLFTRSALAFLFFAAFGFAFVWASASGIGLVVWTLFFGICGVAAILVPREYALMFYIAALFVVFILYEFGLFRTAL